ncbi:uncharacterized protein KRP23_4462 [Phytophthora ramorum]|uniref:uncharacterized protein n=1 Tax=Phytophthora ramorum TaxID=164328 RepID=UPI0030AEFFDA|nr:hypothetical protein KRP23_4462 [Phytophthora ramorum]
MRRAASSALPSYAPGGQQAADSAPTFPDAAPAGPSRAHWWLFFYAVLGFYALAVLGGFVLGWAPAPPAQQQQVLQDRPQVLLQQQKVVVAGPIKVETTAKDENEPEEGWPVQEPEEKEPQEAEEARGLEQQVLGGAPEIGEDEHAAAIPEQVAVPIGSTESPATTAPTTTAPTTLSPTTTAVQKQTAPNKDVGIPTRQQDVVMLATSPEEEVKREEATSVSDDIKVVSDTDAKNGESVKDPNEAEAEMQAPQEKWEIKEAAKNEATEPPAPTATHSSDETQPPVRRSDEFRKAVDLVHLPETKPPNPYFHVFPVSKNSPGDDSAIVSGLRNTASNRDSWTVEGHQHELDRLEGIKQEVKEETERLKLLSSATDKLIAEEKDRLEDKRAASTLDIRTPYYMMPFPPASAGTERGTYKKQFCGMTMVQFDVDGNVLFLHRNAKKLDGKVDKLDPKYWTHLQTFNWEQEVSVGDGEDVVFPANRTAVQRMMSYEDVKKKYQIGIQASGVLFKEFESCYGAESNFVTNFNLTKFEDLPFANLEQELIDYAHQAAILMAQAQGRMGVVL